MTFIQKDKPVTGYHATAGTMVSDVRLERCEIFGCRVDVAADPALRPRFSRIRMIDCTAGPTGIDGASFSDVTIDNLRTGGKLIRLNGCTFRHVKLSGLIESLIVNNRFRGSLAQLRAAYDLANEEFLQSLEGKKDWALDISEAVGEVDVRGIPSKLVRRNPETQVVMTFEQALMGEWQSVLGLENGDIAGRIRLLLDNGWTDTILIANRASEEFKSNLTAIRELQRIGAALPD